MFKLLMDHRDYYRNQYHQTLSDLEKMNKELRDSRESMESKIDQQKKDITEMQKTLDDLKTEVEEISADKEYWKNEAEMFKNGYMKALEHKKEAETLSDELHLVKAKLDAEIQIRQHMKELLNLPDSVLDSEVPNNPVNEEEYLNHLEAHENVAENEQCQQSQKRVFKLFLCKFILQR
uniref:Uncharacterized protein n=1 Tax=Panagrolaimus superbus TaxID=310955 RepID=A0A914YBQ3_9BILA